MQHTGRCLCTLDFLVNVVEMINQLLSPSLTGLLNNCGEFADNMAVTKSMQTVLVLEIGFPKVVNESSLELGKNTDSVGSFFAPFFVQGIMRQPGCGSRVQPMELLDAKHAGFVRIDHRRLL